MFLLWRISTLVLSLLISGNLIAICRLMASFVILLFSLGGKSSTSSINVCAIYTYILLVTLSMLKPFPMKTCLMSYYRSSSLNILLACSPAKLISIYIMNFKNSISVRSISGHGLRRCSSKIDLLLNFIFFQAPTSTYDWHQFEVDSTFWWCWESLFFLDCFRGSYFDWCWRLERPENLLYCWYLWPPRRVFCPIKDWSFSSYLFFSSATCTSRVGWFFY